MTTLHKLSSSLLPNPKHFQGHKLNKSFISRQLQSELNFDEIGVLNLKRQICQHVIMQLVIIQKHIKINYDTTGSEEYGPLLSWSPHVYFERLKGQYFEEKLYQKLINRKSHNEIKLLIDLQNLIEFFHMGDHQNFGDMHNELRDVLDNFSSQQKLLSDLNVHLRVLRKAVGVLGSIQNDDRNKLKIEFLGIRIIENMENRYINSWVKSSNEIHTEYALQTETKRKVATAKQTRHFEKESYTHGIIEYITQTNAEIYEAKLTYYKSKYAKQVIIQNEYQAKRIQFLNTLKQRFDVEKKRKAQFDKHLEILKVRFAGEPDSNLDLLSDEGISSFASLNDEDDDEEEEEEEETESDTDEDYIATKYRPSTRQIPPPVFNVTSKKLQQPQHDSKRLPSSSANILKDHVFLKQGAQFTITKYDEFVKQTEGEGSLTESFSGKNSLSLESIKI